MSKAESSAIDTEMVAALLADGSLLRELTDLFATEAPEQLDLLADAKRRGDAKVVEHAAHRLKGTAVTFGAREMQRLSAAIEELARAGSLNGVEQLVEQLRAESDRVKLALDQAVRDGA